MRVASITDDRLTLESRPWVLGSILVVAILIMVVAAVFTMTQSLIVGIALLLGSTTLVPFFVIFVRRVIVIFDRGAGAVVIRTATVLGQKEKTLPLSTILGAFVQTSISNTSSGRSTTHRPALMLNGAEPLPLTLIYSSGMGADRVARSINQWLERQAPP